MEPNQKELPSKNNSTLQTCVQFPISNDQITPFTDANWEPQFQSIPKINDPIIELLSPSLFLASFYG